jgi:hypothetical protein
MFTAPMPANYSPQDAAAAIMGQEADGWVFKHCRITGEGDARINEIEFEVDPHGLYPNDCVVQLAEDPVPEDHTLQWSGRMLIADDEVDVWLYRAN